MKNLILPLFLIFSVAVSAQVKIGDNPATLGTSSALEIESTNKAMLITRVVSTSSIQYPMNGMLIYDISSNCIKVYQNGVWTSRLGYDPTASVLLQIGEEGDNPNTIISTVTVAQMRTIVPAISGTLTANQAAYQTYIDTNPNNFSIPATIGEVQAMINAVNAEALSPNGIAVIESVTNCSTIISGTLTAGTLVSGVTQTITVNVTTAGTYSITTTSENGVIFTGVGSFASTGSQNVILTASGTPTVVGSNNFSLNTTPTCTFTRTTATASMTCGAIVNGTFKQFMCYNLGVTGAQDPLTYQSGLNNGTLYQWGRQTDGHEVRTSATQFGSVASPVANTFIKTLGISPNDWITPQNNTLWGDGTSGTNPSKATNDPCPAGFKVPSQSQWSGLFKGNSTASAPNNATLNTWEWTGNGFKVGQSLYLPAAGYRFGAIGGVSGEGISGQYWSSTTTDIFSYAFSFTYILVTPAENQLRAAGSSIRCISE